jgi:phospholipase D1/2
MMSPYKHLAEFKERLAPEDFNPWVDAQWLDMDKPAPLELALDRWGRRLEALQRPLKIPSRILTFVMTGLAAVSIATSHVWMVQPLQESPWHRINIQFSGLLLIPILYLLAYFVFAPINLLILLVAGFFPALEALPYLIPAVIVFVSLAYMAGRTLGRLFFPMLSQGRKKSDMAALFLLQIMPIAPHTLVNAAAGAAGEPFLGFLVLTVIGIIPGCLMLALFQRTLIQVFLEPGWASIWPILLLLLFIASIFRWSAQRFANYGSV